MSPSARDVASFRPVPLRVSLGLGVVAMVTTAMSGLPLWGFDPVRWSMVSLVATNSLLFLGPISGWAGAWAVLPRTTLVLGAGATRPWPEALRRVSTAVVPWLLAGWALGMVPALLLGAIEATAGAPHIPTIVIGAVALVGFTVAGAVTGLVLPRFGTLIAPLGLLALTVLPSLFTVPGGPSFYALSPVWLSFSPPVGAGLDTWGAVVRLTFGAVLAAALVVVVLRLGADDRPSPTWRGMSPLLAPLVLGGLVVWLQPHLVDLESPTDLACDEGRQVCLPAEVSPLLPIVDTAVDDVLAVAGPGAMAADLAAGARVDQLVPLPLGGVSADEVRHETLATTVRGVVGLDGCLDLMVQLQDDPTRTADYERVLDAQQEQYDVGYEVLRRAGGQEEQLSRFVQPNAPRRPLDHLPSHELRPLLGPAPACDAEASG